MMPMLSLIQERSRILNTEMENFTYQEILGIEGISETASFHQLGEGAGVPGGLATGGASRGDLVADDATR